jgi:hypothetical protein
MSTPLIHNPARQASDAVRGYSYQIWQTVAAWIQLQDQEILYPECAEDFDKHMGESVSTVQIKDEASEITLGQERIRKAIVNYIETKTANPGRNVFYKYLSRASPSHEKGSPFGEGICGIDVWSRLGKQNYAPSLDPDINKISGLLKVNPTLEKYLKDLTPVQVHEDLIRKITWETAAPSHFEVRRQVEERLAVIGEKAGVPVREAERVAPILYQLAQDCAINGPPSHLSMAMFLRHFESETRLLVHRSPALMMSPSHLPRATATLLIPQLPLSPVPVGTLVRISINDEIEGFFATGRVVVWLYAGSGYGKSTTALCYANSFAGKCHWFDARPATPYNIQSIIQHVMADFGERELLVIDDLDIEKMDSVAYPFFALVTHAKQRGSRILVTGHAPPPPNVDADTLRVPAFSLQETLELMRLHRSGDQPNETQASQIHALCHGHPQLVRAYLSHSVPSDKAHADASIQSTSAHAKYMAGRRLTDPAKALLGRVDVTAYPISKSLLFSFSQCNPPIRMPGNVFHEFEHAWVEDVGGGQIRLSPLLYGIFREWHSQEEQISLKQCYLDRIGRQSQITPWEWADIISIAQYLSSHEPRNDEYMRRACHFFLTMKIEDRVRMSRYVDSIVEDWMDGPRGMSLAGRLAITAVQFSMMEASAHRSPRSETRVQDLLEKCDALLSSIDDVNLGDATSGVFLVMHLMSGNRLSVGVARAFKYTNFVMDTICALQRTPTEVVATEFVEEIDWSAKFMGFLIFSEPYDVDGLVFLVEQMDKLPGERLEQFWSIFEVPSELRLAVHVAVLRSLNERKHDRSLIMNGLEVCRQVSAQWTNKYWSEVFARTLGTYLIEEHRDVDGAESVLSRQLVVTGYQSFLMRDLGAQVAFSRAQYDAVVELLEPVLLERDVLSDRLVIDTLWRLGCSYGETGRWTLARQVFLNASDSAIEHNEEDRSWGLRMDSIYAAYRACDKDFVLCMIREVFVTLCRQFDTGIERSLRQYWNQKMFCHIMSRAALGLFDQIRIGGAGQPHVPEGVTDLPPATPVLVHLCYINLVRDYLGDDELSKVLADAVGLERLRPEDVSIIAVVAAFAEFGYGRRFSETSLLRIAPVIANYCETGGERTTGEGKLVYAAVWSTIFNVVLSGWGKLRLVSWLESLFEVGVQAGVGVLGQAAERALRVLAGGAVDSPEQEILVHLMRAVHHSNDIKNLYRSCIHFIHWIIDLPENAHIVNLFLIWAKTAWSDAAATGIYFKAPALVVKYASILRPSSCAPTPRDRDWGGNSAWPLSPRNALTREGLRCSE